MAKTPRSPRRGMSWQRHVSDKGQTLVVRRSKKLIVRRANHEEPIIMSAIRPTRTRTPVNLMLRRRPVQKLTATAAPILEIDVEIHFCYVHQPDKPVADLRILFCSSPADLSRQISALMKDYPLGRIETVRDDRLGDNIGCALVARAGC